MAGEDGLPIPPLTSVQVPITLYAHRSRRNAALPEGGSHEPWTLELQRADFSRYIL